MEQSELDALIARLNAGRIRPSDIPILLESLELWRKQQAQDAERQQAIDEWGKVRRALDAWGEDIIL